MKKVVAVWYRLRSIVESSDYYCWFVADLTKIQSVVGCEEHLETTPRVLGDSIAHLVLGDYNCCYC